MDNTHDSHADSMLRLPIQYYQMAQMYGPGMPPSGVEGLHQRILQKPVGQIGLVSVHCWNLGEADGPYPITATDRLPGQVADWVPRALTIIEEKIGPVLTAARDAGIAVFHLAQATYAPRYPQYQRVAADPTLQSPLPEIAVEGCLRPWTEQEQWQDQVGPGYPGAPWRTHGDRFDIAHAARPMGDEPVFLDGWQLNGLCRRMDIDTLIYVGFMADICLINIPGAIREMAKRFRYRCIALRDCTNAYEFADMDQEEAMNRAAMRVIETGLGYTASSADFIRAAQAL